MLFILVLVLFSANIYSIDFEAKGIFKVQKFQEVTSNYESEIIINSLNKISDNRFLALLTKRTFYASLSLKDMEEIEKKKREGEDAVLLKQEPRIQWETFIAFISKQGRILQEGDKIISEVPQNENFIPFEMEENEVCPYGYISKSNKKIMCYNYSLSKKLEIEVPLKEINAWGLEFTGKERKIWVLGKIDKKEKNFCYIYDFKKKKWEEVKFSFQKIYENVISSIKKEGQIEKESLNFYNIEKEVSDSTIDFIVSIDEGLKVEADKEIKRRHFFYCSLNLKGDFFSKKLKLLFEIGGSKDIEYNKDDAVVSLPAIYNQVKFSIFPIKDGLLIYNDASVSSNPEQKFLNVYISLFYFKTLNDIPDYFDDYGDLRYRLQMSFEKEIYTVFPTFIHLEKERFLLPAKCFKGKGENEPCYVEADFIE